jgi:cell division protease FtsH
MVFHDPTTGASNDIEKATSLARAMVTQYGMTERLGAIKYGRDGADPFFGREFTQHRDYSEEVAAAIDDEVRSLIETAHHEAYDILNENRVVLDALVVALMEKETLNKAEVAKIFEPLIKRERRQAWTGSAKRIPSDLPPVVVPGRSGLNGLDHESSDEE